MNQPPERVATSQLVRWCSIGEQWEPDGPTPFRCSGCDPVHLLRRRRMLICSVCEMGFFSKKGFDKHECHEAY